VEGKRSGEENRSGAGCLEQHRGEKVRGGGRAGKAKSQENQESERGWASSRTKGSSGEKE